MGLLYDLVQEIAGRQGLEENYFECGINWKISPPSRRGTDTNDDTNPERIYACISSMHSTDRAREPPLEIEFKSLAFVKHSSHPFNWGTA